MGISRVLTPQIQEEMSNCKAEHWEKAAQRLAIFMILIISQGLRGPHFYLLPHVSSGAWVRGDAGVVVLLLCASSV